MPSNPSRGAAPPVPHTAPAAQQTQRSPGLFGQSVGHGLSNMFFGGGGQAEPEPAQNYDAQQAQPAQFDNSQQAFSQGRPGMNCEAQSKEFLQCLDRTNDLNSCSYYLEMLKACEAAAKAY
ncbi:hypothetical protein MSPP1_002002 [Malassezia sp. CBS 17886]|nr:hypothetical protein MSPP1_002002 [Malassezia sp. CBS 17886]